MCSNTLDIFSIELVSLLADIDDEYADVDEVILLFVDEVLVGDVLLVFVDESFADVDVVFVDDIFLVDVDVDVDALGDVFVDDVFGVDVDDVFGVVVFNIVFGVDVDDIVVVFVDGVFGVVDDVVDMFVEEELLANVVDVFVDESLGILTFSSKSRISRLFKQTSRSIVLLKSSSSLHVSSPSIQRRSSWLLVTSFIFFSYPHPSSSFCSLSSFLWLSWLS